MVNAIPTSSFYKTNTDNMLDISQKIQKITTQVTEGNLYNTFTELDQAGKLENVLALQSSLSQTKDYLNSTNLIAGKMHAQDAAMDNIIESVQNIKESLILSQGSSYAQVPLIQLANYTLAEIGKNLNSQYAGCYLFSGSKTETIPLGDLTDPTQIYNYFGNEDPLYAQITNTLKIEYNSLNANNENFHNLFQTLTQIKDDDINLKNPNILLDLGSQIDSALTWLISERSNLEANIDIVSSSMKEQKRDLEYFTKNLAEETEVTVEKMSKLFMEYRNNSMALEAAFKLLNASSKLQLADYI